jgi:hypothetical protein
LALNGLLRCLSRTYKIVLGVNHNFKESVPCFFNNNDFEYLYSEPDSTRKYTRRESIWRQAKQLECKKLFLGYTKNFGQGDTFNDVDWDYSKSFNWVNSMYDEINFPYSIRYSHFLVQRDIQREQEFYEKVIQHLGTTEYIVVSQEHGKLDTSKIQEKCKVFYIDKGRSPIESNNVLDYCTLIERAQAFHGPNCGWAWLIEMLNLKCPKLYMHQYPPMDRIDAKRFPEEYFRNTKWSVFRKENTLEIKKESDNISKLENAEVLDKISICRN